MVRTTNLRRQHDKLLSLANEIRDMSSQLETRDDAFAVSRTLARMTGLLRVHLVVEDSSLYPSMIACADTDVADLAVRFADEMGNLGAVYFAFVEKWNSAAKIFEHSGSFIKEYQAIFIALTSRIKRENSELYPAADGIPHVKNESFSTPIRDARKSQSPAPKSA